jgi:hypothetical protein
MKKLATLTAMTFLLVTAGAFAQTPAATEKPAAPAGKSTKTAKKANKKSTKKSAAKKATTPATPAQK